MKKRSFAFRRDFYSTGALLVVLAKEVLIGLYPNRNHVLINKYSITLLGATFTFFTLTFFLFLLFERVAIGISLKLKILISFLAAFLWIVVFHFWGAASVLLGGVSSFFAPIASCYVSIIYFKEKKCP